MPRIPSYTEVICNCSNCRKTVRVDPGSGLNVRGLSVPDYVRQQHEATDRKTASTRTLWLSFLEKERDDPELIINSDHDVNVTPEIPLPPFTPPPVTITSSTTHSPVAPNLKPNETDVIQARLNSISDRLQAGLLESSANSSRIIFVKPPSAYSHPERWFPPPDHLDLLEGHQPNMYLLHEERWTTSALNFLLHEGISVLSRASYAQQCAGLVDSLNNRADTIRLIKHRVWTQQLEDPSLKTAARPVNNMRHMSKPFLHWRPETLICYLIACAAYLFLNTSLSGAGLLLSLLKSLLGVFEASHPDSFLIGGGLQSSIPTKMETVLTRLQLEPKTRPYVTCTSCFMTYPYTPDDTYPGSCQHKLTPTSFPCNTPLFRNQRHTNGTIGRVPIRLYLYHELEEWLEQLYSRPEIEEFLDRDMRLDRSRAHPDVVRDICESSEVQTFMGPDGMPFIRAPGREGRLLCSLNMDGLNPYRNKEAGKKVSIGAIYMVMLFLPLDIRYDIENMFLVGVIPGPVEPSKDQINHILKPLVDDLCTLWTPGYYIVATPKYPNGRLIIGAIIILVCDLPASRQMSGCAGHSSNNFCSFCLTKSSDMTNFDIQSWARRSRQEHMQLATEWKAASSEQARQILFDKNGVRWSELLRLPYWDPTRFVVIDVMHAFFLGLLKHHVRNIWGMDASLSDSDPYYARDNLTFTELRINKARQALDSGNYTALRGSRRVELQQLSRENNLPYGGRKQTILANLIKHFGANFDILTPEDGDEIDVQDDHDTGEDSEGDDEAGSSPGPQAKGKHVIIGRQTLEQVRLDMGSISLPSWVTSAPKHPGESKTGKLSADQWKSLCTVNLVITLGRLWGKPKDPGMPVDDVQKRRHAMYTNFMHLVSAVKLGSMRTMSAERIGQYSYHIHRYLTALQSLYPWTGITPYQHLSLHLSEMLTRFGPTPGWRCYAFERYNSLLQKIPTNKKFGDLECTIFLRFCKGQNLRILFQKHRVPATLYPLVEEMKKRLFNSTMPGTGTLSEDLFATPAQEPTFVHRKATTLPTSWQILLKQWIQYFEPSHVIGSISCQGNIMTEVKRRAETFSTFSRNPRHCLVYYREPNGEKSWAARIQGIFTHERPCHGGLKTETFVILERFQALPLETRFQDPFCNFPVSGRLFLNDFHQGATIAPLSDVLHPFASYPYYVGHLEGLLALPLDRV